MQCKKQVIKNKTHTLRNNNIHSQIYNKGVKPGNAHDTDVVTKYTCMHF